MARSYISFLLPLALLAAAAATDQDSVWAAQVEPPTAPTADLLQSGWGPSPPPSGPVHTPSGTYTASATVLGVRLSGTVTVMDSTRMSLTGGDGKSTLECLNQMYGYDEQAGSKVDLTQTGASCIYHFLKKAGATLSGVTYNKYEDTVSLTVRFSFVPITVTLKKQNSLKELEVGMAMPETTAVHTPSGTYSGSASVVGYQFTGTVTVLDSMHMDLSGGFGKSTFECLNQMYGYDEQAGSKVTITQTGASCLYHFLKKVGATLSRVTYNKYEDTVSLTVRYLFVPITVTLKKQNSLKELEVGMAMPETTAPRFTWDTCGTRLDRLVTNKVTMDGQLEAGQTMTVTATGTTNLHVPLETGAWQVRVYEIGVAKETYTEVGDLMAALKFLDAKKTTFSMSVTFTLPPKQASGHFSANIVAVDQAKADYLCLDAKYDYFPRPAAVAGEKQVTPLDDHPSPPVPASDIFALSSVTEAQCAAHKGETGCNAVVGCSWCKAGAVPSQCHTKANAMHLPPAVFVCS